MSTTASGPRLDDVGDDGHGVLLADAATPSRSTPRVASVELPSGSPNGVDRLARGADEDGPEPPIGQHSQSPGPSKAIRDRGPATSELCLTSGAWVRAHCQAVSDGHAVVGCVLRLDPPGGEERSGERRLCSRRERVRFGWASLTANERGVAEVVAQGMTNREVAARLFLSPHAVDYHLRQVFRKLGIRSRVELSAVRSSPRRRTRGDARRRGLDRQTYAPYGNIHHQARGKGRHHAIA